ncbi:hypothetical protein D3C74_276170 [compost metagenome]
MNLVAECTTMSAPKSIGRSKYGLGNVLSTISGMPCSWAIAATASMSSTSPFGLPSVSAYNAFVLSVIAARKFSGFEESTNFTLMPSLGSVVENRLNVPPYSVVEETISSPAPAMFKMEKVIAAWPEAVASAPTPPSSAATRFSNTSLVGFIIRE